MCGPAILSKMLTIEEIRNLNDKEKGTAMLAIRSAEVRQTSSNKDYLNIVFVDKTGNLPAKVWDWGGDAPETGTVWRVGFEFSPFKGAPQIVVRKREEVNPADVDKGLFIDSLSTKEFAYYKKALEELISAIEDKSLKRFIHDTVHRVFPEYLTSVGASYNHHARLGGLLQHSVHVTKSALAMANSYNGTRYEKYINKDLLLAGGVIHDLGKVGDYTTENLIIDYTVRGSITRHYTTGPAYLMEAYSKLNEPISREWFDALVHIMVSHHGAEHSDRAPACFTAWLLHGADISDCFGEAISNHVEDNIDENGLSKDKLWVLSMKVFDERVL